MLNQGWTTSRWSGSWDERESQDGPLASSQFTFGSFTPIETVLTKNEVDDSEKARFRSRTCAGRTLLWTNNTSGDLRQADYNEAYLQLKGPEQFKFTTGFSICKDEDCVLTTP